MKMDAVVKVRIPFQGSGLKENEVADQVNIRVIIAQFVLGRVRKSKKGQGGESFKSFRRSQVKRG